uniref:Triatoma infestans clone ti-498 60s ribosomal protein l37 n=1 Tax=Triatoma infestans TaxID=30076 RepID=A0A161MYU8_TRIIF
MTTPLHQTVLVDSDHLPYSSYPAEKFYAEPPFSQA